MKLLPCVAAVLAGGIVAAGLAGEAPDLKEHPDTQAATDAKALLDTLQ